MLLVTFVGALGMGLVIQESTAWAFTCDGNGNNCVCGSWDTYPTGGYKLGSSLWAADCAELAAYCQSQDASPYMACFMSGGSNGGSCTCRAE